MKRYFILFVLALAGLFPVIAQEGETPVKPDSTFEYEPIRKGDQFIRMGLGLGIPLFNLSSNEIETTTNLELGGTGIIGYSRFLNSKIALGGEIAFSFNSTLGDNLFFYLPITFKATYAFVFKRIHIPVSLGAGFAFQTYNTTNYFGPIIKPEIGAYYQFSPDWSYGATVAWNIIPQYYKNGDGNRTGNILDVALGVRYHF